MIEELQIQCPHCGEYITIAVDTSSGSYSTIEDCQVCCSPMTVDITCQPGEIEDVQVSPA
jgi:hypothetical protein